MIALAFLNQEILLSFLSARTHTHTLTRANKSVVRRETSVFTGKTDRDEDLERSNLKGQITNKTFISPNIKPDL